MITVLRSLFNKVKRSTTMVLCERRDESKGIDENFR